MNATLQITEKCNLRCHYCFEGEKSNTSVDITMGEKMIKFTIEQFKKELGEHLNTLLDIDDIVNSKEDLFINSLLNEKELNELEIIGFFIIEDGKYKVNKKYISKFNIDTCKNVYLLQKYFQLPCLILFYGGETFIEFELLKQLILYTELLAERNGIQVIYELITNGYFVDENIYEFLRNRNDIRLKVSIDGSKESHDANRVTVDGSPSFDIVIHNAAKLLQLNEKIIIAMVVTPQTVGNLCANIQYLYDLGFTSYQLAFEELVSIWDKKHLRELRRQYLKLGMWCAEIWLNGEYIEVDDLNKKIGLMANKANRIQWCGSGEYKYFINVKGEIFPCPVGNKLEILKFGDINKGFYNMKSLDMFKNIQIETCDSTCRQCVYNKECHLTCFANNLISTKSLYEVSDTICNINKIGIQCCTDIGNYMYEKNKNIFEEIFYIK